MRPVVLVGRAFDIERCMGGFEQLFARFRQVNRGAMLSRTRSSSATSGSTRGGTALPRDAIATCSALRPAKAGAVSLRSVPWLTLAEISCPLLIGCACRDHAGSVGPVGQTHGDSRSEGGKSGRRGDAPV